MSAELPPPPPLFSREELAAWARICRQEVQDTLAKRDSYLYEFDRHVLGGATGPDGRPYELLRSGEDPPLCAYATRASAVHVLMRFSPAPLASVLHGCVGAQSSDRMRAMLAHMYGRHFVDGGVLQVAEGPTRADPFHCVSVTFLSVKAPVIKARRYILFEHSGSLKDANGELVVFKVARSIPAGDVPLAQLTPRSAQLAHGEAYIKLLLRGSHGGERTDVVGQGLINQGSGIPGWAAVKLAVPLVDAMARIGTSGASRALAARLVGLLRDSDALKARLKASASAGASTTPACRVCRRRTRRLAATRVCIGCEREVCRACTKKLYFVAGDRPEAVKLRFCRLCVHEALSAGGQADAASTSSTSSDA